MAPWDRLRFVGQVGYTAGRGGVSYGRTRMLALGSQRLELGRFRLATGFGE